MEKINFYKKLSIRYTIFCMIITILMFIQINYFQINNNNNSDISLNTNEELKLCPFCGGKAILHISDVHGFEASIECEDCGIYVYSDLKHENSINEAKEYVISKWNKRVDN